MSKFKVLLKVFVILLFAFSLTGFICDEKEDAAKARIFNATNNCVVYAAKYGETQWDGPWDTGEYSVYKNFSGKHAFCLDAENTGGFICGAEESEEPEDGETYTITITSSDCTFYLYSGAKD